jgi:hypothetical protein
MAVTILFRNLFVGHEEIPQHLLSALSGRHCLMLVNMANRTGFEIFCATMLTVTIIEIVHPSKVHEQTPKYTGGQRIGWGIFHAWAWTSFAFGIEHVVTAFICGR